jgi:hypothetical protein
MDETWVNHNDCTDCMWLPNDWSDALKIPSGKGERLIVLHAGTRSEGLIVGCHLVFLANSKDCDYHQEMISVVHDIIPCFPKRSDLSQIITPIIDNSHLIVQNISIITYFFY